MTDCELLHSDRAAASRVLAATDGPVESPEPVDIRQVAHAVLTWTNKVLNGDTKGGPAYDRGFADGRNAGRGDGDDLARRATRALRSLIDEFHGAPGPNMRAQIGPQGFAMRMHELAELERELDR